MEITELLSRQTIQIMRTGKVVINSIAEGRELVDFIAGERRATHAKMIGEDHGIEWKRLCDLDFDLRKAQRLTQTAMGKLVKINKPQLR